jgi:hypothetical protein
MTMGTLDDLFNHLQATQTQPVGTQEMRDSMFYVPSESELRTQALNDAFTNAGIAIAQNHGDTWQALGDGVAAGFGTYNKMTSPDYRRGLLRQAFQDATSLRDKDIQYARGQFDDAVQYDTTQRQNKLTDQTLRFNASREMRANKQLEADIEANKQRAAAQEEAAKAREESASQKEEVEKRRQKDRSLSDVSKIIEQKRKELGLDQPDLMDEETKLRADNELKMFSEGEHHKRGLYTKEYPARPRTRADVLSLAPGDWFINGDGTLMQRNNKR